MEKKIRDSISWSEPLADLLDEVCERVSYMTDFNINWGHKSIHQNLETSSIIIVFWEEEKETKQIDLFKGKQII